SQQGEVNEIASEMWTNTPLNELDLTLSEKGGPSYRHLPKNFPLLSCSERTSLEQSVLNDLWVSVPVGSEGGGSDVAFKHMRKNQHEDLLFKASRFLESIRFDCEDERFELDMVIEAGSSAINLLEPMEEEIKCIDKTAGARYQFKLDRRVLSPVQLAAITRIYGDHGAEILELLRKNPCKTVPVILARLRQKDVEWRVSRERLNKLWSNVQRGTYYKSLDRRSIDLKNEDKKAHSARVLVADITHRRTALLAKEEEPKPLDRAALADAADAAAKEAAKASSSSSGGGGDEDDDVKGKGKGKKDDDMETEDNEAGSKEGKGAAGGDGDKGKAAAAEESKDESNQDGTNDASSSSPPGKQQQKVKAETQNGGGKAGEEGARQAAVDKMVADHEAQVKAAKQAKAERYRRPPSS
ncbi:unnamed protein product, partial [Ectocarpus sp. 13 AM-2016]